MRWNNASSISSRRFVCGYCGSDIAPAHGYYATGPTSKATAWIYICHHCFNPTYFSPDGKQIPGVAYGNPVYGIPKQSVISLYEEARNCTAANVYTATVLCGRKLLMNIAVSKGAKKSKGFAEYVNYLSDEGFVPPDRKGWVDHIRKKGNEATHEIAIMKKEDAEDLLSFIEMSLKFIYEFPARMQKKTSTNAKQATRKPYYSLR